MDRDKYLKRTYGISLEDYNQMLKKNNNGCWICGYVPGPDKRSLAVDHDHKLADMKVVPEREGKTGWRICLDAPMICHLRRLRNEVLRDVRMHLKKLSVRGLLCWQCNAALKKFKDDPERMESAAKYIRNYRETLTN